jgi:hypothetical protein
MSKVLSEDFARIPALIDRADAAVPVARLAAVEPVAPPSENVLEPLQLGLF